MKCCIIDLVTALHKSEDVLFSMQVAIFLLAVAAVVAAATVVATYIVCLRCKEKQHWPVLETSVAESSQEKGALVTCGSSFFSRKLHLTEVAPIQQCSTDKSELMVY